MDNTNSTPKLIQWKYFRNSLVMYLLFYVLPIFLLYLITKETVPPKLVGIIIISWVIGGITLIAAISAYRSKGAALWEPALAAVVTFVLVIIVLLIIGLVTHAGPESPHITRDFIAPVGMVFLLGIFGSWIGGRYHKVSKKGKQESN